VVQWGLAYVAGAWALLQGIEYLTGTFDWPRLFQQLTTIALLAALPIALALAWFHGEKGEQRITRAELAVLTVLMLLAGGSLWIYSHQRQQPPAVDETTPLIAPEPRMPAPARSIAVLPFTDLSERHDQEYFSDGLSEELINLLAQVPQLRVIARTSSFSFKGKDVDIAEIARKLNVAHVLEGSVRKSGNRLRITAQLIRASDSTHVWSKTYDQQMTDVFQIQDEIAAAIVGALKMTLATPVTTAAHRTANTDAYLQFLLGRKLLDRFTPEDFRRALEAFRRSVALDPDYGSAYAGLALAQVMVADALEDPRPVIQPALAAAEKAIELAPGAADGYGARAVIRYWWLWDWNGALEDFETALALDPSNADVRRWHGQLLETLGRVDEAIALGRRSIESNPLSAVDRCFLGGVFINAGRLTEAREAVMQGLEIDPQSGICLWLLGNVDLTEGSPDRALATYQKITDLRYFQLVGIAMAEHALGHANESQLALDELLRSYSSAAGYQIAEVYAWRGQKDEAFAWLDRAYVRPDAGLLLLPNDVWMDSLRRDPRYGELLRKMKLRE
jgi:TolB-like protein/thioredoxin-like negative regulator of GroEL